MSTQPLLPSYASATQRTGIATPTASIIQTWSLVIFVNAAVFSTIWASKGNETWDPQSSPPLLPYFATLSIILAFGCWVGYLFFISYDSSTGPGALPRIIISTSIIGKLILGVAHLGFRFWYLRYYTVQPNWVAAFLAAQAWWDLLLLTVYSCLRVEISAE
jgi:hypothetical protein